VDAGVLLGDSLTFSLNKGRLFDCCVFGTRGEGVVVLCFFFKGWYPVAKDYGRGGMALMVQIGENYGAFFLFLLLETKIPPFLKILFIGGDGDVYHPSLLSS
jgi:hypothetical protein